MKVGDLVKYRGWRDGAPSRRLPGRRISEPLALIVEQRSADSPFHHRIRVMWIGEEIPVQAQVLAVTKPGRLSTWINPKYFELIESVDVEVDDDPDRIWRIWGDQ